MKSYRKELWFNIPTRRAFVNITFDDVFVVRGLKVIQGNKGLFVCMPSRKLADGTYKDIAHPINNEFRQKIETMILNKYQKVLENPDLQDNPDPVIE